MKKKYDYLYIALCFVLFLNISCLKNIVKPSELLKKIYQLENDGKYKELEKYFFNIEFKDVKTGELIFNSKDKFIDAIKREGKVYGAFEYSRKGLLHHIEFIDDMIIPSNDELNNKYLVRNNIPNSSVYITYLIKKKKEDLLYYINGYTVFVFIIYKKQLKFLFSANMGVIKNSDQTNDIKEQL